MTIARARPTAALPAVTNSVHAAGPIIRLPPLGLGSFKGFCSSRCSMACTSGFLRHHLARNALERFPPRLERLREEVDLPIALAGRRDEAVVAHDAQVVADRGVVERERIGELLRV